MQQSAVFDYYKTNVLAALADAIPYKNSILTAHFNHNPATTVTVHYAPTEGDNEATDHYE